MRVPPSSFKISYLYKLICLYILVGLSPTQKNLLKAQCGETVNAGSDIFLCESSEGETIFLAGSVSGNPLFTEWSSASTIGDYLSLATTANVTTSTTFTLTAFYPTTTNLVVNGDFEDGNVGFSSDYNYTTESTYSQGFYSILTSPTQFNSGFGDCDDPSGSSNELMLVADGATVTNSNIWCQTINVTLGTYYVFSGWIASVISSNPASLTFTINGMPFGAPVAASATPCIWNSFSTLWEANAAVAEICIINQNTAANGNDFALDDISFVEICEQSNLFNVYFDNIELTLSAPEDLNCENSSVELIATYSTPFGSDFLINWNTTDGNIIGDGFSDNVTVDEPGTYTFTFFNFATGCVLEESVEVGGDNSPPVVDAGESFEIDCINTTVVLDGTASDDDSELTFVWTTADGNIVSDEGTLTPTVDAPGTYILTITNEENGCSETSEVSVVSIAALPAIEAIAEDDLDCVTASVLLNANGSEEGDDITYVWTTDDGNIVSGIDGLNPEVDQAGTYTLLVTNTANGCTSITNVIVEQDITIPDYTVTKSGILNCENNTVLIEAIFMENPPNPDFTLEWTTTIGNFVDPPNGTTVIVDEGGGYSLVVTNNSNGCSFRTTVIVGTNFTTPMIQIEEAPTLDCNTTETELDAGNSDQGSNLIFLWSSQNGNIVSGANTLNPTVNGAGTYELIITNTFNGCTNIASVEVNESLDLPIVTIDEPAVLNCEINSTTLSALNENTEDTFTYQWTSSDGTILSNEDTTMPEVEGIGVYTLLTTNLQNGCTSISEVTVTENIDGPTIDIDIPGDLDCLVKETSLFVNVTGDPSDYSFEWSSTDGNIIMGNTETSPLVGSPGTYEVTVTNITSACTSTAWVTVNELISEPQVEAGDPQMLTCDQESLTLNGSGGLTANLIYEWTTTNGSIQTGVNSFNPTVNAPGTYTLTVTDIVNGCSSTDEVEVTQDLNAPIADAGPSFTLDCETSNYTLDGTNSSSGPEFTFEWSTDNGSFQSDENTLMPVVNAAGTYQLTIYNTTNQCETISTVTIEENIEGPAFEFNEPLILNCINDASYIEYTLPDFANISIGWETEDGEILWGASDLGIAALAAGTYFITIADDRNGCTSTTSIEVFENFDTPEIEVAQGQTLDCSQSQIQLQGIGSDDGGVNSYLWTTTDGNIVDGEETLRPTINQAGIYILTAVNNESGCEVSSSVNITQNEDAPQINIEAPQDLNCDIQSLTLDASQSSNGPEFTYTWSSTDGSIISGENTLNPEVDAAGIYMLTIVNTANQCETFSTIIIEQNVIVPEYEFNGPYVVNCEINSVQIIDGLQSNYEYAWETSDGSFTNEDNGNGITATAGSYNVTISDPSTGCSSTTTVIVTADADIPEIDAGTALPIDCNQSQVGLSGFVMDDNGNHTYLWTTDNGNIISGENSLNPIVDQAGIYTLTVVNTSSQCENVSSVTVEQNDDLPEIIIEDPQELNCEIESTILDASQSTEDGDFNYNWTTDDGEILSGQNSLMAEINMPGTYTLTISSDISGCSSTETITVTQNIELPLASPSKEGDLSCTIQSVNLASNILGAAGLVLEWTSADGNIVGEANTETIEVDQAGTYTLSVTSLDNQCMSSYFIEVSQDGNVPFISINEPEQITCAVEEVILDASASSEGSEFIFQWSTQDGNILGDANSESISVDTDGVYELIISNTENGCSEVSSIEVFSNLEIPIADAGENQELNCFFAEITLNGEGSSNGPEFEYSWTSNVGNIVSGQNTTNPVVDANGFYNLIVLNTENGCSSESMIEVFDAFDTPNIEIEDPEILTCENESSLLLFNLTTLNDFSTEWSTIDGNIIAGTASSIPEVDLAGTYEILVTDLVSGCTNTATVEVFQNIETPIVDAGDGLELTCNVAEYILDGTGSEGTEFIYSWTTSDGNIVSNLGTLNPSVDAAGTYILEIINSSNGCKASDDVIITRNENIPTALEALVEPPLCFGDLGTIEIDFIEGGVGPYLFSIDGGKNYFEKDFFDLLPSGEYDLMVQDANGCEHMDQVSIPFVSPINVDLTPEVQLLFGESEQISSNLTNIDILDIESINWTPIEGLSCSDCLDPIATPSNDIIYTLTITTHNGCETSAAIQFKLDREIAVYIPNAFTPHGKDGINDIFHIFAKDGAVSKIHSFQIYDRWGNKVFVDRDFLPNDPNHGWNGVYKDEKMNSGVFVYYAEIEFIDGSIEIYKGDVTLLE